MQNTGSNVLIESNTARYIPRQMEQSGDDLRSGTADCDAIAARRLMRWSDCELGPLHFASDSPVSLDLYRVAVVSG